MKLLKLAFFDKLKRLLYYVGRRGIAVFLVLLPLATFESAFCDSSFSQDQVTSEPEIPDSKEPATDETPESFPHTVNLSIPLGIIDGRGPFSSSGFGMSYQFSKGKWFGFEKFNYNAFKVGIFLEADGVELDETLSSQALFSKFFLSESFFVNIGMSQRNHALKGVLIRSSVTTPYEVGQTSTGIIGGFGNHWIWRNVNLSVHWVDGYFATKKNPIYHKGQDYIDDDIRDSVSKFEGISEWLFFKIHLGIGF